MARPQRNACPEGESSRTAAGRGAALGLPGAWGAMRAPPAVSARHLCPNGCRRVARSAGLARHPVLGAAGCPAVRANLNDHPAPAARAVPRWLEPSCHLALIMGGAAGGSGAGRVSSGSGAGRVSGGTGVAGATRGAGTRAGTVSGATGAPVIQAAAAAIAEPHAHRPLPFAPCHDCMIAVDAPRQDSRATVPGRAHLQTPMTLVLASASRHATGPGTPGEGIRRCQLCGLDIHRPEHQPPRACRYRPRPRPVPSMTAAVALAHMPAAGRQQRPRPQSFQVPDRHEPGGRASMAGTCDGLRMPASTYLSLCRMGRSNYPRNM